MTPGVVMLLLCLIPHPHPIPPLRLAELLLLIVAGAAAIQLAYPWIARDGETESTMNIVRYIAPVVGLLLLFPAHPELAVVVLAVVAFGDGSATLFGLLFGKRRLPWNEHKTWAGFVGFIACSLPLATLAYWLQAPPGVGFRVAVMCALSAVCCGEIAESLPLKSSDNLRVGVSAAIGVLLAQVFLAGLTT
jgi:phytol kinase